MDIQSPSKPSRSETSDRLTLELEATPTRASRPFPLCEIFPNLVVQPNSVNFNDIPKLFPTQPNKSSEKKLLSPTSLRKLLGQVTSLSNPKMSTAKENISVLANNCNNKNSLDHSAEKTECYPLKKMKLNNGEEKIVATAQDQSQGAYSSAKPSESLELKSNNNLSFLENTKTTPKIDNSLANDYFLGTSPNCSSRMFADIIANYERKGFNNTENVGAGSNSTPSKSYRLMQANYATRDSNALSASPKPIPERNRLSLSALNFNYTDTNNLSMSHSTSPRLSIPNKALNGSNANCSTSNNVGCSNVTKNTLKTNYSTLSTSPGPRRANSIANTTNNNSIIPATNSRSNTKTKNGSYSPAPASNRARDSFTPNRTLTPQPQSHSQSQPQIHARVSQFLPNPFSPIDETDEFMLSSTLTSTEKSTKPKFNPFKPHAKSDFKPLKRRFDEINSVLSPSNRFSKEVSLSQYTLQSPPNNHNFRSLRSLTNEIFNRKSVSKSPATPGSHEPRKLSVPRSPNLKTKQREKSRPPVVAITSEEKELLEINEYLAQKRNFSSYHPKTRIPSKSTDNKIGFPMLYSAKNSNGNGISPISINTHQADNTGRQHNLTPKSSCARITEAKPFNLETEKRHGKSPNPSGYLHTGAEATVQEFKARPMPTFLPFEIKKSEKPCIIPETFDLETELRAKVKEDIKKAEVQRQEEMLRSMRIFRAMPIPDYSKLSREWINPFIDQPKPTIPLDIKLNTAERAMLRSLSGDNNEEMAYAKFKAAPVPDFSHPFLPKLGLSELTEVEPFDLKTESRTVERAEFEQYIKEREAMREMERKRREEEERLKEKEEVEMLRKQMVFKAGPIRYLGRTRSEKNEGKEEGESGEERKVEYEESQ